ncbi:MAG: hypothetical protein HRU34_24995 [Richelia sp.]|nr:hypothetical protein [Richelia sp.]
MSFTLHHRRKLQDELLGLAEEKLITSLAVTALQNWSNLYTELAGSLKCDIKGQNLGLAQGLNLQSNPDREIISTA